MTESKIKLKIPVIVVLKHAEEYMDKSDNSSMVDAVAAALQPFSVEVLVEEYPWIGVMELRNYMVQFIGEDPELAGRSEDELQYYGIAENLYRDAFGGDEVNYEVFETKEFNDWIKLFDPVARWDAGSRVLMSRQNPDGRWTKWEIGGVLDKMFLVSRDGQKITSAYVRDCDPGVLVRIIANLFPHVVVYERGSGKSEWVSQFSMQRGYSVQSCTYDEWHAKVGKFLWELDGGDYVVIVECEPGYSE